MERSVRRRVDLFILSVFATVTLSLWPDDVFAQHAAEGLFQQADTDWAHSWLEMIFRGTALPQGLADGAVHLDALSRALREALSVYSLGMLVIGGFLVAYHVVSMVAETAHTGTIMGRRTNTFWAPIRFVLAIGLLMPIGGGLNSGQYLIVKLAEAGSSLASNAWRTAAETMKGSLSGVVAPRGPDVARLTAVAMEMELCRSLYRAAYAALLPDAALIRAGDIQEFQKIPLGRLMPETWRYSNALQADAPLCGEYRFLARSSSSRPVRGDDETENFPNELADFARADAERLTMQARAMAERVAPSFLNGGSSTVDISANLALMMQDQQKALDAKLRAMTSGPASPVDRVMAESTSAGWIAAGFFVGNIVRRQSLFGAMTTYAIPSAQAPVFGHKALDNVLLMKAIDAEPVLRSYTDAELGKLAAVYAQTSSGMRQIRQWLYGKQVPNGDMVLADTLDVGDQIGSASDSGAARFVFARLLNNAMATYGVWADPPRPDALRPSSGSLMRDVASNPLAGLAETGRRYSDFGSYLLGMSGPVLSEPSVLGSALLFVVTGLVFGAMGFLLLFVVPLLPLFRFFMGVLTWLLAVLEAVAALPLVALAHLHPSGEGLSGPVARHAYWLWLSVFMRPLLTLFGFVIGLLLLTFGLTLLNNLYGPLTHALMAASGDVFVGARLGFALFYAVFVLALTNAAFKGIGWLPDKVLSWLGHAEFWSPAAFAGTGAVAAAGISKGHAHGIGDDAVGAGSPSAVSSRAVLAGAAVDRGAHEANVAEAKAQGLKSALIPAYREPPVEPVNIPKPETAVSATITAAQSSSAASTAASGEKATAIASASAHATAVAMSKHLPLPDRPTPKDIEKALEKISRKIDKREELQKKDAKDEADPSQPKETREQTSVLPEDDTPA